MANLGMTKTLLILLLALRELKTPLSNNELEALKNEGFALETSPEYWEDIEKALMAIIKKNEELNRGFQEIKKVLDSVEEVPPEIFPTWGELEEELPYEESHPVTFGVDTDYNFDITTTTVAASRILKFANPTELAQNLSCLKRLNEYYILEYIHQSINPDFDLGNIDIKFNLSLEMANIDMGEGTEIEATEEFREGDESAPKRTIDNDKVFPEARYINTGFYTSDRTKLIETEQPLALDIASYILKVNVGEFWGIGSPDTSIPQEIIRPFFEQKDELEMEVVVHSFDIEISFSLQKLQFPKTGSSDFVYFPITLTRTGRQSIDIDLLFHGHLLQSKRVEFYVVEKSGDKAPESAFPVQDAYITWTRSATFEPDELAFLKENPRRLTIVTERDIDYNRIGLRFYDTAGEDLGCQFSKLTDDNLTQVLAAVRTQLVKTMNAYTGTVGSTEAVLTKHLGQLADIGRSFYTELLPKLSKQVNQTSKQEKIRFNLKPKTIIQVAPLSSQLGVPWELLYERKIESYREGRIKLCPTWKEHGTNPEDCPSYGTKEEAKVICPHSFWGYRYIIEQLPCKVNPHTSAPEHSLPILIHNQLPLQLKATVFNDFKLLTNHWKNLRSLASDDLVELIKIDSLDKFESAVSDKNKSADILYFYTHGGIDTFKRPYFKIGTGDEIKKNDLEDWIENFNRHQPLVVLNACDSADYTPESFENLLQLFYEKGAAGVVGTQCAVKEKLANELIINFFESFLQQTCAGEALFQSRKRLLNKLDPRGLAYSLFASADLKLAQPVVNSQIRVPSSK